MADENKKPTWQDVFDAQMAAAESYRNGVGSVQQPTYTPYDETPAERKTTYEDLYKAYYDSPMSREEEDRRKHAATQVNAVRHLGNAMNAFSNLIFTGGAAPSQTLPTLADPNLQAFSDRARAARYQYGDALIKGRMADDNAYRQDDANAMQKKQYNDRMKQQEYENGLKGAEVGAKAKAMEADAVSNAYKNQQNEEQLALQNKRADNQQALGWANHNLSKERLKQDRYLYENGLKGSTRRSYSGSGKGEALANGIDSAGNWYTIDTSKLAVKGNITPLRTIYNRLPQDIREEYDMKIRLANTKDLPSLYQDAIGNAIESDKSGAVVEELKKGGYAVPYRMMNGGSVSPTDVNNNLPPSMREKSSTNNDNIPPSLRK